MKSIVRGRGRLLLVLSLIAAGYFVYAAIAGAIANQRLEDDRAAAQRTVASLEEKKSYLEAVRNYVASDAYVEQEARRRLGYTRDGEVPFVVISPPLTQDARPRGEWWERLFPR